MGKRLNRRNPFRKGTTVKEFVSYITNKLDGLGYEDYMGACEATEEDVIEGFADREGLDLPKLYDFMAKHDCNCCCTIINNLTDRVSEDTILETAVEEVANEGASETWED